MSKRTETSFETIKVEREPDGITFVVLNRPEKRNAMSPELHREMSEALDELETEEGTKIVIVTGAGDSFSAGQDIKLYFRSTEDDPKARARARHDSHFWRWEKLSKFAKPTIAMVNGFCFGGAFTPVCACDFAIAADEAVFGLSEVNWGILPGGIVAWNVTQVMSYRDALYYACTGDTFNGKEATAMRLVNFSVPRAELKNATLKFARKLLKKSPAALRYTKECVRQVRNMSEPQAADYLNAKSDALRYRDPEKGRAEATKQFLDEKSYKPGLGEYRRKSR
ncbi:MAG TPA: p-hydroxycinnamoyl CoA hydratase/lyase [Micropepsaceae bacterium]|nr:p-hydroxycinnamoyl CoA hydratase/lyase [Micropepsaceae bacterium]